MEYNDICNCNNHNEFNCKRLENRGNCYNNDCFIKKIETYHCCPSYYNDENNRYTEEKVPAYYNGIFRLCPIYCNEDKNEYCDKEANYYNKRCCSGKCRFCCNHFKNFGKY